MKNDEFLTKLAKQYTKEAGEKYKLENDELAKTPTPGLDAKVKKARRPNWHKHRLTFIGVAASVVVIIIAGIAFLPEVMRETESTADMIPMAAPEAFSAEMYVASPQADMAPVSEEIEIAPNSGIFADPHNAAGAGVGAAPVAPPALPVEVSRAFGVEMEYAMPQMSALSLNLAIANFSQSMFNQVLAVGDENAVISALSAYYVLAMVAQGAAGQTLEEFEQVLGFDPRFLAHELQSLAEDMMYTREETMLNIAGSVWVHDDQTVNAAFNRAMEVYFAAPAKSRDFFAPETIPEINRWVYENTEGLIDSIVDELDPYAVMLLINALYFKGQWENIMHYNPNIFRTTSGESIAMDFLSTAAADFQIAQTPQFEAALLPYSCNRFGFLLVRPTDGTPVREFAATHSFANVLTQLEFDHATIQMPGLDLSYDIKLNDILQNMGLVSAFDSATANFSELIYTGYPLEISRVLQEVRIILDRYGTEAAAVTSVAIPDSFVPPVPTIDLIFNTPYMYAIIDMVTGIPLFMGVVDNPNV